MSVFRAVHRIGRYLTHGWLINASRLHLRHLNQRFAEGIQNNALVLDAGAGTAPYAPLFAHTRYETADFEKLTRAYASSTYVCDLTSIPVENERFDHIVFNQVMEHLPEPGDVLRELHRVMKPGGTLVCTCPLFYEEHEQPYDFFRYTQFAHYRLFKGAGFRVDELDWLEGYFGTVGYQLEMMWRRLPARLDPTAPNVVRLAIPLLWAAKAFAFVLAGFFYRLDTRYRYTASGMPKNYVIHASKPAVDRDD